jgi:hypothetical protein
MNVCTSRYNEACTAFPISDYSSQYFQTSFKVSLAGVLQATNTQYYKIHGNDSQTEEMKKCEHKFPKQNTKNK